VHSAFFVTCLIVTLAQCRPLEKMWDLAGTVEGTCINTTAFFYCEWLPHKKTLSEDTDQLQASSAFNIVTDIWILALPFKTLRSIQRPTRDKVALFFIFGAGAFAAIASIVRLHTIYIYTLAKDPFRDGVAVNLWSMIEVTIAISCASVSAVKPIFSSKLRKASRDAKSSRSATGSSNAANMKYMLSNASNGPRQRARLASLDDSSMKGVLASVSSNHPPEDGAHDPESWAVPASLLQPGASHSGSNGWEDMELTFLQPAPEREGLEDDRRKT